MIESPFIDRLIQLALDEDLSYGDVTSAACIEEAERAQAALVAKESFVVCGLPIIARILHAYERTYGGAPVEVTLAAEEGQAVSSKTTLATLRGSTRTLLALERTTLNFLQRLCGVASHTRSFVSQAGSLIVLDTRKTLPGWRVLEKYACYVGGARNHRAHLGDMVLVKNNHVDAQSGSSAGDRMRGTLRRVREGKGFYVPVEVEVRSLEELHAALEFSPQAIMLDNFSDDQIKEALPVIRAANPRPIVEVSGGVSAPRLAKLSALGVDCVSVGGLTTQAVHKDISMRLERIQG